MPLCFSDESYMFCQSRQNVKYLCYISLAYYIPFLNTIFCVLDVIYYEFQFALALSGYGKFVKCCNFAHGKFSKPFVI